MTRDEVKITAQEILKMKNISPIVIPINPSSQGWSGSKTKEFLSKYIFDSTDGLIAKINEKNENIYNEVGDIYERFEEIQAVLDFILENGKIKNRIFFNSDVNSNTHIENDLWFQE